MSILRTELSTDPLGRGYVGMTDQQAADSLNTPNRDQNKDFMSGDEVFQATDSTEWSSLTAGDKQLWLAFCGRETINPFASANVELVTNLFGGGSATVTNLADIRVDNITRAEELGVSRTVTSDMVAGARN